MFDAEVLTSIDNESEAANAAEQERLDDEGRPVSVSRTPSGTVRGYRRADQPAAALSATVGDAYPTRREISDSLHSEGEHAPDDNE